MSKLSNTIQPSYGTRTYSSPTKAREARQTGTQGSSFMDMAARAGEKKNDVFEVNGTEATQQKAELSKAEEMQLFKKEFYEDLSKIICNPTVSNAAVNISDAAFQAMKDDPEYRAQVLALLQRDLGASYAPRNCSVLITVGTSLDQYRADSWPVGNDSEFHTRSKVSFWEQRMERHKKYMELAEEAAAKRRLMMKLRMNGGFRSPAKIFEGVALGGE